MVGKRQWSNKPWPGQVVDTSAGITKDMLCAFAVNEGAGGLFDPIQGLSLAPYSSSSTWTTGNYGSAALTNASGAGFNAYAPPGMKTARYEWTIVWSGTFLGTPTNNASTFQVVPTNVDGAPYVYYGVNTSGTGTIRGFSALSDATYTQLISSVSPASRGPTWLAFTHRSGAQRLYIDDPYTANQSDTQAISSFTYGSGMQVTFGSYVGPPARNPACSHDYGFIWNRILTNDELASIKANPWQVFKARQRYFTPSGLTTYHLWPGEAEEYFNVLTY